MDSLPEDAGAGPVAVLSRFRRDVHSCFTARADELCELADVVVCADGPVRSLAGLSLAPEHRPCGPALPPRTGPTSQGGDLAGLHLPQPRHERPHQLNRFATGQRPELKPRPTLRRQHLREADSDASFADGRPAAISASGAPLVSAARTR